MDYDYENEDNMSFDDVTNDTNNDSEWDYQKEDKTCKMCAGTGFMGADNEEGEETCPFCCGAGIE